MSGGLKRCIDADSADLIRNLPHSKTLLTQFISIVGSYSPAIQIQTEFKQIFCDPSPAQYAIIRNKPNALQALIYLCCNSQLEENPDSNGYGIPIDDIFLPKPFSTNCKFPLLNLAVHINNFRCLKVLVKYMKSKNHSIDTIDRDSHTPLLEAVLTNNSDMALYLLKQGANPLFTPRNNNALGMPIMHALFVKPDLFLLMVKTLAELNMQNKYLPLLTEKFDPETFQISPSDGKSLKSILESRQDLAFSRNAFLQIAGNSKPEDAKPPLDILSEQANPQIISSSPQKQPQPQQMIQKQQTESPMKVILCEECSTAPSCCICPECGKHLCAEHDEKHECIV